MQPTLYELQLINFCHGIVVRERLFCLWSVWGGEGKMSDFNFLAKNEL